MTCLVTDFRTYVIDYIAIHKYLNRCIVLLSRKKFTTVSTAVSRIIPTCWVLYISQVSCLYFKWGKPIQHVFSMYIVQIRYKTCVNPFYLSSWRQRRIYICDLVDISKDFVFLNIDEYLLPREIQLVVVARNFNYGYDVVYVLSTLYSNIGIWTSATVFLQSNAATNTAKNLPV